MSASFSAALIERLLPKRETLYGQPERKTLKQAIRVERNRRRLVHAGLCK